jgi:hypothetical protein
MPNATTSLLRALLHDAATLACLIACWAIVVLLAVGLGA